jgi:hypothetical protein
MLRLLELFGSFSWDIAQQGKQRITKKVQVQGTGTGPRKSVTSERRLARKKKKHSGMRTAMCTIANLSPLFFAFFLWSWFLETTSPLPQALAVAPGLKKRIQA